MATQARPLAVVTGASTGIGFELARICAQNGYNLIVVADEPGIEQAAEQFRASGTTVDAVQADLATIEGVDELIAAIGGRSVAALLANAWTRPWSRVSRPGLEGCPTRHRHERHRHAVSDPRG